MWVVVRENERGGETIARKISAAVCPGVRNYRCAPRPGDVWLVGAIDVWTRGHGRGVGGAKGYACDCADYDYD